MTGVDVARLPAIAGTSDESVKYAIDTRKIVVCVEDGLDPVAGSAAAALVSVLARTFPHIDVRGDVAVGANPWGVSVLSELLAVIERAKPAITADAEHEYVIAVGASISSADLWLGGGDWTVLLGTSPQPVERCRTALGLHAGAALAAAEAVKAALGPLGMLVVPMADQLSWNLIDYHLTPAPPVAATPERLAIDVVLFGAGSVGSTTAGILACIPGLCGTAVVVDPDIFDPTRNPQRYPASTGNESGSKAAWVAQLLAGAGLSSEYHAEQVGDWVRRQEHPGVTAIVVSSVDTLDGRLQVADAVARTTLTLGVGGMALHLQRSHHDDELACPFCEYVSAAPTLTQTAARAAAAGLTVERVGQLELTHVPLTEGDVQAAVVAGRLDPVRAADLVGRRLEDLLRRAYAEASVPLAGGGDARVGAPYVSLMAGVLAVAELVKSAMGIPLIDRRVDIDLTGVPLGVVSRPPRDLSGRCTCSSGLRRRWAVKLYG
jgi:hypothetical protein